MNVTYALRRVIILVICLTELCKIAGVRNPYRGSDTCDHVCSALYSVVIYIHKGPREKKHSQIRRQSYLSLERALCRRLGTRDNFVGMEE